MDEVLDENKLGTSSIAHGRIAPIVMSAPPAIKATAVLFRSSTWSQSPLSGSLALCRLACA
jgi:hypothetical protein